MRLNPGAFNKFLDTGPDHIGQDFLWRRGYKCPCTNPQSGAAKPNCRQCQGKAYFWDAEPGTPARCGMSSQQNLKLWAQFGQYEPGDATLTIPSSSPLYALGRMDRLLMLNSTEDFSATFTRGKDRFWRKVQSIYRVFWLDDDQAIVEGSIPTVQSDGDIVFTGDAPPFGRQYNVSGTYFDEYFIWQSLVSDRGEHSGAALPKKALARKLDLLGRK